MVSLVNGERIGFTEMGQTDKGALTPGGRYFVGCWTRRVRGDNFLMLGSISLCCGGLR
jgi:hypothetical protein